MEHLNKAIVTIRSILHGSIYGAQSAIATAKGFILDKKNGLLLTNKHIANKTLIQDLYVTFFNNHHVASSLLYNDPEHDFAIIQVAAYEVPEACMQLRLSEVLVKRFICCYIMKTE
ncbi:serine protease [Candidatus Lariskella endosymbiont of Epinotia ramella]|uniref:S1 family peptidase n=1 Tax=Candidatus Lariskella endosymbiont of Epinotia ramella TaxID=3066224 RepID=UPI0030D3CB2F